uniref:Uncharacterized protein n=1 Tax=Panagrolaimus sp. ES5 TaxID=591445 RepID=A0AC34GWX7_9BILA
MLFLFILLLFLALCYGQDPQPCPENPIVLTGSNFPQYVYSPYDERKNYPPNTDCRFVLLARNAQKRLHLTIIESELEIPIFTDCNDYVSIKDGSNLTSHEIVRWCGKKFPTSLTSSNDALYILFHSDNVIQRRGFNLSFVDFDIPGCPPDWISFDSHCYKLFTPVHGSTWLDAQKECTYERSNLLTFEHKDEYTFIFDKFAYAHTSPWLGYHDAQDEEHFQSINPKEALWPENFPKFFGDHGSKDCIFVDFNIKEDSAYVVDDCRNKRSFICKKENVACYQYYKKRVHNRVGNLDQNQRLVAGTTGSTTITTTTTKNNHENSKTTKSSTSNDNNNNTHKTVTTSGGSASKIKTKDIHGVVRPLRQTSTDKNRIKTAEVTNDGNLKTTTDSPRFNMAANQPGAITVFNAQHVEHLEKEQAQHENATHHGATSSTIIEMPSEEDQASTSNAVQTLIEEENGNLEVENIIRNHVVVSDDDSFHENSKAVDQKIFNQKLDVSVVNDDVIEEALHPSNEINNDNGNSNSKNPTFSHSIAISDDTTATKNITDNVEKINTGNLNSDTNAAANTTIISKEDKTAMTDPASNSIHSEDFDGIQMNPMNPHTQRKQRRSHIHILSNVDAKTPEEFWEQP